MGTSLLDLPTELRHTILEYAIKNAIEPPQKFNDTTVRSLEWNEPCPRYRPLYISKMTCCVNLLLVNRMFCDDVLGIQKRGFTHPVLDIVFELDEGRNLICSPKHGCWLLMATWLLPPQISTLVLPTFELRIRSLGIDGDKVINRAVKDYRSTLEDQLTDIISQATIQDSQYFGSILPQGIKIKVLKLQFETGPGKTHTSDNTELESAYINPVWCNLLGVFEHLSEVDAHRKELARYVEAVELFLNKNSVIRFDFTRKGFRTTLEETYIRSQGARVKPNENDPLQFIILVDKDIYTHGWYGWFTKSNDTMVT